jgi:hypothetical protein
MTDSNEGLPSVSRLTGQLGYLFEERPELRHAPVDVLVDQLNHEDRYARARARYPVETDAFVRDHVGEFAPRITGTMVEAALHHVRDR